jgi:HlyD family secretion protein
MSRKIYLAVTLIVVGGLVAVWHFLTPSDQPSANGTNDVPDLGAEAPISVKVQYARQGTLVLRLTATGYTRAICQVPLTAQVAGVVDSLPVYEGKAVRKDELLLKINDADYLLAVAEAKEQLNQTMVTYGQQRAERLNATIRVDSSLGYYLDPHRTEKAYRHAERDFAAGKISQENLFLLKSEYEAAQIFAEESKRQLIASRSGLIKAMIGLQRAELNLSRTRLIAPFSGIVANLKVAAGQPISAGTECMTLVNLDTILIDVEVLESEAPQVEMGRHATATFAAFPNEVFKGKVVAANPLVDVEKRVRRAVVAIANKDHRLIPGLYAQVKIESQFLTKRLIVPKEAIVLRDQRKVVFIVRNEGGNGESEKEGNAKWLAKWCYVETGAENEEEVEVTSSAFNLQPGEPVVVTNHFTMAHDTPVRVEQ